MAIYPVYYKLYLSSPNLPVVIELQSFDECDYDGNMFISHDVYDNSRKAEEVLNTVLVELYNRDIDLAGLDRKTAIALTSQVYNTLFHNNLSNLVDDTMERITEAAQLSTFEEKRIRQIISGLVVNLNNR